MSEDTTTPSTGSPTPEGGNSKNALYIVVAIIVLALGAYLIWGGTGTGGTAPAEEGGTANASAGEEVTPSSLMTKEDVLAKVNSTESLTPEEIRTIFSAISGTNIQKYGFTEKERAQVMQALNRN